MKIKLQQWLPETIIRLQRLRRYFQGPPSEVGSVRHAVEEWLHGKLIAIASHLSHIRTLCNRLPIPDGLTRGLRVSHLTPRSSLPDQYFTVQQLQFQNQVQWPSNFLFNFMPDLTAEYERRVAEQAANPQPPQPVPTITDTPVAPPQWPRTAVWEIGDVTPHTHAGVNTIIQQTPGHSDVLARVWNRDHWEYHMLTDQGQIRIDSRNGNVTMDPDVEPLQAGKDFWNAVRATFPGPEALTPTPRRRDALDDLAAPLVEPLPTPTDVAFRGAETLTQARLNEIANQLHQANGFAVGEADLG